LAIVYIGRVIEAAYFQEPEDGQANVKEVPWTMLLPMWVLVIANIYFGVDTSLTTEAAKNASQILFQSSTEISALVDSLHGPASHVIGEGNELSVEVAQ